MYFVKLTCETTEKNNAYKKILQKKNIVPFLYFLYEMRFKIKDWSIIRKKSHS